MEIWTEGDKLQAVCEKCGDVVDATYRYRTVHLQVTNVDVPNVLVGVCDVCDEVVSIPHQSAPRLKEAREVPAEKVEYRLPRELDDVLHLIAAEFGVRTDDFTSPLLKFYMREFTRDASFRRRVGRLSRARLATRAAASRSAFRADAPVVEVAEREMRKVDIQSRSDLVRGLIVAAKEDVLDNRAPKRKKKLLHIAEVI